MKETDELWAKLRDEQLVSGEPPVHDGEETPWPLRLLAGAGAWLATLLMLGAVSAFLALVGVDEDGAAGLGFVLCAISAPFLVLKMPDFVRQCGTVLSIAGLLSFGFGAAVSFDLDSETFVLPLFFASLVVFAISRVYVHQFLAAFTCVSAASWLVFENVSEDAVQPALAWISALLWVVLLRLDPKTPLRDRIAPAAWATTFLAVGVSWLPRGDDAIVVLLDMPLLPAVALVLLLPFRKTPDRLRYALLLFCACVLAWVWRESPGVTLSLSLMLVAFALGSPTLLVVGILSLAGYLVAYYYQLSVTLLDKSIWLGLAGVLLISLRGAIRPWPFGRSA